MPVRLHILTVWNTFSLLYQYLHLCVFVFSFVRKLNMLEMIAPLVLLKLKGFGCV